MEQRNEQRVMTASKSTTQVSYYLAPCHLDLRAPIIGRTVSLPDQQLLLSFEEAAGAHVRRNKDALTELAKW